MRFLASTLSAALIGLAVTTASHAAAAPPFSVREADGRWWVWSPEGKRFFSRGVCVVTRGISRESFDLENPGYAAWQHYATDADWADATLARLGSWGFTTVGAWSDHASLIQSTNMLPALTPILHLGSSAGAPWWDMWDEKIVQRMDDIAREQIVAVRADPRLLGYYSDNEMGWWNATLFHMALDQPATSGQRQRLVALLRGDYGDDWARLMEDFDAENANSFAELGQRGQLYLRPGSNGVAVMRRFLSLVATRYYQLAHDIIRRHDPRGLVLGDRYQTFYYPEVARAAAPYVDAISSNLNATWNDGGFVRFHLDTLHALTGRPVFVSEFYVAATENRSGNRNDSGRFPVAPTQSARARGIGKTMGQLAALPYVVGADWFQYFDEPRHGREDGENFNFGLVDIEDRPYEAVTRSFSGIDLTTRAARGRNARVDVSAGVPRAPEDPFRDANRGWAMQHWDRERGFVPPATGEPVGDLYVCWNPRALYVGLHAFDMAEDAYYRNKTVPKADRAVWTVQVNRSAPIRARIGSGREAFHAESDVRIEGVSGLNLNVRNIMIMEIPASRLGRERLRAGERLDLDVALVTHGRAYRVEWRASSPLSTGRR